MILMKFYRNVICRPSTTHWVGDDIGDCTHVDVHDDLHDVHASPKYKDALHIHAGYDVRDGDNDDVNDVHASSHKEIHAGES